MEARPLRIATSFGRQRAAASLAPASEANQCTRYLSTEQTDHLANRFESWPGALNDRYGSCRWLHVIGRHFAIGKSGGQSQSERFFHRQRTQIHAHGNRLVAPVHPGPIAPK